MGGKVKEALFLLFPATAFLYYPFWIEEFETGKVFALITFSCFAAFWVNWRPLLKDRTAQTIFLLVLSAALSTVFSVDWHISIFGNPKCRNGLLVSVSYLVVYLAAIEHLTDIRSAKQVIDLILWCSGLVALYALTQVLGYDFKKWNGMLINAGYTRPMSSLGHPNFMANYLAMTVPFALWRIDESTKMYQKSICALLVVISMSAIFLSLSRGMFLASVFSVSVYLIFTKTHRRKFLYLFSVIVGIGLTVFTASPVFRHTAIERYQNMVLLGQARSEYPKGAIRIWKQYPWLGVGTDAFEIGFQNQRTPYYWQIERGGSPHRAHNDFLNILATQGILGALVSILFTIAVFFEIKRSRSPISVPATAAIVAFYIAGMSGFVIAATGTMFVACLAFLRVKQ